jgi:hypothetical protein
MDLSKTTIPVTDIDVPSLVSFLSDKLPHLFEKQMNVDLRRFKAGVSNPPIYVKTPKGEYVLKVKAHHDIAELPHDVRNNNLNKKNKKKKSKKIEIDKTNVNIFQI